MKHLNKLALGIIAVFTLTACSGGSSSKTDIFGNVPELLEKYNAEKDALKEKGEKIRTEEEKAKLIAESKKLDEEYAAKIEKASQDLDGKTIEVTGEDLDVTAPLTLTYDGWYSKNALVPQFKVTGEAKTTKEITIENAYTSSCSVQLVGCDAEGNDVFNLIVGKVAMTSNNGTGTVAADTPVEFTTLSVQPKFAEGYKTAKTIKLVVSK